MVKLKLFGFSEGLYIWHVTHSGCTLWLV